MITFFNNPYDKVSVNTLQFLFVNGVYPTVIYRTTPEDDRGLHISFLPTVVFHSDDYQTEYARIETLADITPDTVNWLFAQQANLAQGKPIDTSAVPTGVILKN